MIVTYFILNFTVQPASHSAPMKTIEGYMFEEISACLVVLGNIGKYNPYSILDMIIYPLGNCELILSIVGHTLFK